MRRVLAAAGLGVLVALALATGGSARATKLVVLNVGDVFTLANTHVVCTVQVGQNLLKGKTAVGCSWVQRGRPAPGSKAAALAADGEALLVSIDASGTAQPILRRKPARSHARAAPPPP